MKFKYLYITTLSCLAACTSTTSTYKVESTTNIVKEFKFCLKHPDQISDSKMYDLIANSIMRESKYGPFRLVQSRQKVSHYKGLSVTLNELGAHASFTHRHHTALEGTKGVSIDSFIKGKLNLDYKASNDCKIVKISPPENFDVQIRKDMAFFDVELIDSPENMTSDFNNALAKAKPVFHIPKSHQASNTIKVLNLTPSDITTLLKINNGIKSDKIGDEYKVSQNVDLSGYPKVHISLQILPLKSGSILTYEANFNYVESYFGNGTSKLMQASRLNDFGQNIEHYISAAIKN